MNQNQQLTMHYSILFCAYLIASCLTYQINGEDKGNEASVIIENDKYSLLEAPSTQSREVQKHLQSLQHHRIQEVVRSATETTQLLNISYYAVIACGPEHTEAQIKIQEIGFRMSAFLTDIRVALHKIGLTSDSVVDSLVNAHSYMFEGNPTMGLSSMDEISKAAAEILPTWDKLLQDSKDIENRSNDVLEFLKRQKGQQNRKREELKQRQAELEKDAVINERKFEQAQSEERKNKDEAKRLEDLEEEAVNGFKLNFVTGTVNFLTRFFFRTPVFYTTDTSSQSNADRYNKRRKDAAEAAVRNRRAKEEARQQMEETLLKMSKNSKLLEGSSIEDVADSLHLIVGRLRLMHSPLRSIIEFLQFVANAVSDSQNKNISSRFKSLIGEEGGRTFETAIQSRTYKREAVKYYAFWIAIGKFSKQFDSELQETKDSMHKVLKENPSWKEAKMELSRMIGSIIKNREVEDKKESEKEKAYDEEKDKENSRQHVKTEL